MSMRAAERRLKRREFLSSALVLSGFTASLVRPSPMQGAVSRQSLDPVSPDILFGTTSSIWGKQHDVIWAVKRIATLGLQGIEPYGDAIEKYRKNPMELKKVFDDAGITFI